MRFGRGPVSAAAALLLAFSPAACFLPSLLQPPLGVGGFVFLDAPLGSFVARVLCRTRTIRACG